MRRRITFDFTLCKGKTPDEVKALCVKAGIPFDPTDWDAKHLSVADSHGFIDDPEVIEVKW